MMFASNQINLRFNPCYVSSCYCFTQNPKFDPMLGGGHIHETLVHPLVLFFILRN